MGKSPDHPLFEHSQEVLGPCVVLGEMFGFMSLAYVRDFFAESQDKPRKSVCDIAENVESTSLKPSIAAKGLSACDGDSLRASSCLAQESPFHQNLESFHKLHVGAEEINCDINNSTSPERNCLFDSSRHPSPNPSLPQSFARTGNETILSTGRFSLRGNENRPSTQQHPSFSSRPGTYKPERNTFPRSYIDRTYTDRTRFSEPGPQKIRRQQLLVAPSSIEQLSSEANQGTHRTRLPSPLREVSGNDLNSSEVQLQRLVISKNRKSSEQAGLSTSREPSHNIDGKCVKTSGLKSPYPAESPVLEDHKYNSLFLGKYRTPSSPEFRYSGLSSSLRPAPLLPRSTSLYSLGQVSIQQNCTSYIGINNPRLFIPVKPNYDIPSEVVKYRKAQQNELKTPLLTPKYIIGPLRYCFEPPAPAMTPRRMSEPPRSAGNINESEIALLSSRPRRNSSTVADAGSEGSVSPLNYELPTSASLSKMHTVEEEEYDGECPTLDRCNVASNELATASGATESKSSSSDGNHSSDGKAPTSEGYKVPKVRRRESTMFRPAKGKEICPSGFEMDDLNSGARSTSDQGDLRNPFTRTISFVDDGPRSTAAHSRSLSAGFAGPSAARPVHLIPPRMRGPSFSSDFEHYMNTLPMPPTDHVTPGGSRRSSEPRDRTISVLSEKPEGFWSNVRSNLAKPFKGCFGTEQTL